MERMIIVRYLFEKNGAMTAKTYRGSEFDYSKNFKTNIENVYIKTKFIEYVMPVHQGETFEVLDVERQKWKFP